MNTRELTKDEAANLSVLNSAGIESELIFLTQTGLSKSILDATKPFRQLLLEGAVHNFESQGQGEESKVMIDTVIFNDSVALETKTSLYRPKTKKGDPRLWIYHLKKHAQPDDILSVFIESRKIYIVNLSKIDASILSSDSALNQFIDNRKLNYNEIANELLFRLGELAKNGPLESIGSGSTSIGRTIEAYLGIDMNSSPEPDYKGIELKSGRSHTNTRDNLFAKVADWDISNFKSSRHIVERVGYEDQDKNCRRLYCTVNTRKANPQGLILDLNHEHERLDELLVNNGNSSSICAWRLSSLHNKLKEKHPETFWIKAKEIKLKDKIHFKLESVKHTRKPSVTQFNRLLDTGEITLDHLIKLQHKNNRVNEKGPIFKIKPSAINELFLGESQVYNL